MDAAEDLSISFHAVSNDPAVAVGANRRQCVDRAFEAIERVTLAGNNHLERFVIFILANFAYSHTTSLSHEIPCLVVLSSVSNGILGRFPSSKVEIGWEDDNLLWRQP